MWTMTKDWPHGRGKLAAAILAILLLGGGIGLGVEGARLHAAAAAPSPAPAATPGGSSSIADLVERLSPSVVNIKVTKVEKASGPGIMGPGDPFGENSPFGDLFRQFFGRMPQGPREFRRQGAGSGFIIRGDGLIVTNNHVVEGAKEVTVTLADKEEYPAKVVGRDPKTDIALVKIDPKRTLTVAPLGDSDGIRVGEWVVAIGNPFGLNNTVTAGIVSAKGRVIGAGPYDDFIQTDASINPGNSGGPLFDLNGQVVGINSAIISDGQGIGFAVPVNMLKSLLPQLEAKGEVTRGYLGARIQALTPELAKSLKLTGTRGALVADVTQGSPAEAAGLRRGDVIVAFDGREIAEMHTLPALVAATPIGKEVPVKVVRDGQEQLLSVKIASQPGEPTEASASPEQPAGGKWGLALSDLDARTAGRLGLAPGGGVLVTAVQPGSPAERASLRPGDVLLEVNRTPVHSVQEVQAQAAQAPAGASLLVLVKRGDTRLFVALEAK